MKKVHYRLLAVAVFLGLTYIVTAQPSSPGGLLKVVHDGTLTGSGTNPAPLKLTLCGANQIYQMNGAGSGWACAAASSGLTTAGSGLGSSGSTVFLNITPTTCATGSGVTAINSLGSATCTADVTSVVSGTGITASTTAGAATVTANLAGASCSAGSAVTAISSTGTGTCSTLASIGAAAGTGTSGRSTRWTASATVGTGAWTDDGANATANGTTTVQQLISTQISPTAVTGAVNDWAPINLSTATTILVTSSSGSISLTGITGGVNGRRLVVVNHDATQNLIIKNEQTSSVANRIVTSYGDDILLGPALDSSVTLEYWSSRWHVIAINTPTPPGISVQGVLTAVGNLVSTAGTTTVGNFRGTNITPSLTGGATVNDWAPTGNSTAKNIFVNCPSTVCTITGLVNGADGRELTIYNTGAGEIDIPNASGLSSAGNKFNNSDYGGVVILMANSGCSVQYTYSSADSFWHETGRACDPVIQQQATAVTVSVPINLKNTAVNGWVDSTGTMYAGGDTAGAYLSTAGGFGATLGYGFGTNATFTGYINMLGYNEGTTQFRSLWIQDGKGSAAANSIAQFDGPTHEVTFVNQPIGGMGAYAGTHVEQVDEWCGAVTGLPTTSYLGTGWQLTFSGTGAGLTSFTHSNGHPCELSMGTGTGTAGQGVSVVNQGGFGTSDGNYTWESTVRWPTLSSTTNSVATEYVSELGFLDTPQNKTQGNGFFFMYDKGNFAGGTNSGNVDALQCVSRESGGGTQTAYLINNTGNSDETFPLGVGTIVANTWYRLKIVVTGTTRAEFYRDAGSGYVKVCDINTHMPTGFGAGFVTISNAATGTGNRSLEVDQSRWAVDLTSVRSP